MISRMRARPFRVYAALMLALFATTAAHAQERFSLFVASDQVNVERMLKLVDLRDDDVVIDLGSGDGRIVLTAARMNGRLTGWGVDVDEKLVKQSNQAAQEQGLANRVRFFHRNAFDADLSKVTVIAMWLWPELKRMLRDKILAEARPGTRITTSIWDLGDTWKADKIDTANGISVFMWVVPANIQGNWNWEMPLPGAKRAYAAVMAQQYQRAEGVVRVGTRRGIFENMRLSGEDISFTLGMTIDGLGYVKHEFFGKVRGDTIAGTARVSVSKRGQEGLQETFDLPWHATRGATSAYFAPTGLDPQ